MLILGIETSCDETAAAVVENGTKIISNVVASSQEIHAKYGGIIPEKAAREQVRAITPVIKEALQATSQVDAIAVTVGPGLIGSLLVGVETAKTLALAENKPIVPVNHLVGHIYANWLAAVNGPWPVARSKNTTSHSPCRPAGEPRATSYAPVLPAVVLIVSGGHTELVLMKDHGKFKWLGGTRDDAAGECFDKSARILGLGYPGGPAVEAAASKIKNQRSKSKSLPDLPRPIINEGNFDFSFSGLKTAVANIAYSPVNCELESTVNQIAFALQESVTDVLVTKTLRAAKKHRVKSILLAGGVAANRRLREKLSLAIAQLSNGAMSFFVPPVSLCTDNAACIASAAYFNYYPLPWQKISPDPGLDIL